MSDALDSQLEINDDLTKNVGNLRSDNAFLKRKIEDL